MAEDFAGARKKMRESGPRKLLALDGGGIRGLITIEILAKIEELLGKNRPDFRLAQYFDYIGGTSTGAVIGTLLSLGRTVSEIRKFYLDFGKEAFDRESITLRLKNLVEASPAVDRGLEKVDQVEQKGRDLVGVAKNYSKRLIGRDEPYSKYEDNALIEKLKHYIGDNSVTLSTNKLNTLLLLILSNATTDSPWPVSNNPKSAYAGTGSKIPLWQLVRASTAAPLIFPPQEIEVGGETQVFVDGGITPYNNPAFQLFLEATLEPYRLEWPVGEEKMLLVSIGTGLHPNDQPGVRAEDMHFERAAKGALKSLFSAALYQQDMLCRVFGRCLAGDPLDDEVNNLIGSKGPLEPQRLFTYLRYNATLTDDGLKKLDIDPRRIKPEDVRSTDSVQHMDGLQTIGQRVAELRVKSEHFAGFPA